jgi:hypothetical protein
VLAEEAMVVKGLSEYQEDIFESLEGLLAL